MTTRKIALLTGASRGIGQATAQTLAKRGYDVALCARSAAGLEATAQLVRDAGGQALVLAGDLGDWDHLQTLVPRTLKCFGRVDLLVNNAAWRALEPMPQVTLENWEKCLRISLTAPAFLSQWAAAAMAQNAPAGPAQQRGVIINISSIQSRLAAGVCPPYIAAKGAMDALTHEQAITFGRQGIRVIALNPGAIDTEMSNDYPSAEGRQLNEDLLDWCRDMTPLARVGTPEEVGRTIAMLASDDATFITGVSVIADGGISYNLSPYSFKHRMFPGQY